MIRSVTLVVTELCNTSCKYCYGEFTKKFLETKNVDSIIEFIDKYKHDNNMSFKFIGGEPLTNFDFIKEITEKLSTKFRSVFSITTNLLLLNDSIIDFFIRHNFKIKVSLDGMELSHNRNRKEWKTVFNNLLILQSKYRENNLEERLSIHSVLSPENISNIESDYFELKKFSLVQEFALNSSVIWSESEINEVANKFFYLSKIDSEFKKKNIRNHLSCVDPKESIVIGANYKLYFCHRKAYEGCLDYGNVFDGITNLENLNKEINYNKKNCRAVSEEANNANKILMEKLKELEGENMKYFDLKVGFSCNNNCIHCVITDKKSTNDLSTEEIKSIIDTIPKGDIVGFTGGEATIRSDFLELLRYAKETGHSTALQTNGAQFSDWDFAVDVSKLLDSVLIAIHSHISTVHDSIVRVQGMYDKTIEGFKNIIKLKIPCRTQTVISKLNIEDLLETYDFIQSIKPGIQMNLTFPHPNGNAYHNADIVVPRYSEIKDVIQSILKKYGKLLSTEAIPMCYLYPYQDDVYNIDEDMRTSVRPGLDPANKNNTFFNKDGFTENYSESMLADKRKAKKCLECVFNDRCVGVWKEYIEFYRNNFDCFPIVECKESAETQMEENEEWGAVIVYGQQKCMNTCLFCSGTSVYSPPEEKLAVAKKEVDYHYEQGIRKIELSGGDPGEFSKIVELVQYIKNKGMKHIQLSTHGRTLQNEELVRDLARAGITQIKIPLYGSTSKIHNLTAQSRDSEGNAFEESLQGLKNCSKYNIPISGYILLNQYNKEDINNIIRVYMENSSKLLHVIIGITFIAQVDYSYTKDWFLPIKDMKPYLNEILNNNPLPKDINLLVMDVPFCVIEKYDNRLNNPFEKFPNLGLHDVEESNRSKISSKIPHYRIKQHFSECNNCCLKEECGGIPENELRMFGYYGLKGIKNV